MSEESIIAIASDAAVRLTAMEFEEIMKLQIVQAEVNAKAEHVARFTLNLSYGGKIQPTPDLDPDVMTDDGGEG